MQLKVIVERGEDGMYVAHAPALRGCWSQGTTRQEAVENIREAIAGWLEAEQDKVQNTASSAEIELVNV